MSRNPSTPQPNNLFIKTASALALEAGARLMALRLTPLLKERKADHSLVTNADKEADHIIRSGLRKAFPGHAILTEESAFEGSRREEFVWVVDPLDGTRAYVRGTFGFSVMVGLLKEGIPYAGVVYDPWEDRLYSAVRGEGSFHTFKGKRLALRVSERDHLDSMPIITSTGFPDALQKSISAHLSGPWIEPVNSVGIKVGLVVRQLADIYVNHHAVHFWDTCAPQMILEEAGGKMTFVDGTPISYDLDTDHRHAQATLATNGARHADLIKILRPLMGTSR